MHFVPFPSLTETERFAGLLPIDASRLRHGPDEAVAASHISDARRVRLIQRVDGPVYIVSGRVKASGRSCRAIFPMRRSRRSRSRWKSRKRMRSSAASTWRVLMSPALRITINGACRTAMTITGRSIVSRLNDPAGTELYVSSTTGEVVLGTTRDERVWNYLGSVVHWIYPTVLRRNWCGLGQGGVDAVAGCDDRRRHRRRARNHEDCRCRGPASGRRFAAGTPGITSSACSPRPSS